ncbi:hypothetical protein Hdeb2414_s0023g00636821 [Helianthus debilis subsp. tardiflorus]
MIGRQFLMEMNSGTYSLGQLVSPHVQFLLNLLPRMKTPAINPPPLLIKKNDTIAIDMVKGESTRHDGEWPGCGGATTVIPISVECLVGIH